MINKVIKRKVLLILLALSGFIPLLLLLRKDPTLLIYSLFVLSYFLRDKFVSRTNKIILPKSLKFFVLVSFSAFIVEIFAWLESYLNRNPNPPLLHPQLFADLISAVGFYGSWVIAWLVLMKFFKYSLKEVFVIQGLYGIFIEQQGAVFLQGLTNPLGVIWWVYVFLVYGSVIGIAYLPVRDEFFQEERSNHWIKYPLAFVFIFISTLVVSTVWTILVGGFLPQPKPIWEHPFW